MLKFKVMRFTYGCTACRWPNKNLPIVKFEDSMSQFGIGTKNTSMDCPMCGIQRFYNIDTWWGGSFFDKDTIYLDTAKKKKLKVSDIQDVTYSLLKSRALSLKQEVTSEKRKLKGTTDKLKALNDVLAKEKEKKKDGQGKS